MSTSKSTTHSTTAMPSGWKEWLLFHPISRRNIFQKAFAATSLMSEIFAVGLTPNVALAVSSSSTSNLTQLRQEILQARSQMNPIPDLIQKEQWDMIRAILITPPLSDLWTKSARSEPLVRSYANAVGEEVSDGDELLILEANDELLSHLRYLDMAVYNNVFNPIVTMGKTGATKELIRSYYEDPLKEYTESISILDQVIKLDNVP